MELRVEGDRVTGGYLLTRPVEAPGPEIAIEGHVQPDGSLDLAEQGDAEDPGGSWRGQVHADFSGTRTDTGGQRLLLFLTPLPEDDEPERPKPISRPASVSSGASSPTTSRRDR